MKEDHVKNKKRMLILVVSLSLVFSLVAFAADETRYVKVTAYDVNIRGGAGTEQPVVGHAQYGDTYQVISVQNGWYQVKLSQDQTGWISTSLVKEGGYFATSNPTIETAEATTANLNVRDGASTSYDVITTISPGTTYPLLQTSGDWIQIRLPDERTGWVNKSFIKKDESKAKTIAKAEQQEGTVIADTLNVRSSDSEDAPILGALKQGDIVHVQNKGDAWTKISFQNQFGYVKSDYIRLQGDPTPQAQQPPATGNGPTLQLNGPTNFRSGPGTNFALLQTGAAGDTFSIVGKSGQWWEIALENGKKAWVANWLVQVSGSSSGVPERNESLDSSLRGKTIVLDAGHGGFDVGAIGGTTGLYEKDATLALTRILYNKLVTTGATVVMTRSDDHFVSLNDRVNISKEKKADLFVSLHYNTNPDPKLSGTITYYYNEQGADHTLANLVEKDLTKSLGLPDLGTRFGDFYVLRENPQTAILIETSFLSNARDEAMAKDQTLEEKAAEGMFQAIVSYLDGQNR
jgi:N-acetylmuramoyl-L-alanine amidase